MLTAAPAGDRCGRRLARGIESAEEDGATAVVGLVALPGPAAELAVRLGDGLADQLGEGLPGAR